MAVRSHGMSTTKPYRVWLGMKTRCTNPNHKNYLQYGGRGITVCSEWSENFESFYNWLLNNGYKEGLTVDRIDVNGNYEPSNCRLITQTEQTRNKRNNRYVTINGITKPLISWCEYYGISRNTVYDRLYRGLSVYRALGISEEVV
jgi:hypothetical protein